MTKGHNRGGPNNDAHPEKKGKGEHRHLTDEDKKDLPDNGRNPDSNPSDGTKGKNSIS